MKKQQQGFIFIIGLVTMAILFTVSTSLWTYSTIELKASRASSDRAKLIQIAEAGIDKAAYELNSDPFFSGETDVTIGEGVYITTITSQDAVNKTIRSTAYIPDSTNPRAQLTVKTNMNIDVDTVTFNFALQVGEGGLSMSNNSSVQGNIFSNGSISGSGTITGDATVAGGAAAVLDQSCTTNTGNYDFNTTAKRDVAQKFIPAITDSLSKVSLYIKKTGSPSNASVRIVTHTSSGDKPSTTQVGGTGTISSSTVTSSYGWLDVTFSSAVNLTSGTSYWLVIDTSSSTSNYYTWAQNVSNSCTGLGKSTSVWSSGSASWVATGGDLNYRTYMGGTVTTLSGITVNGDARANTMTGCSVGGDAYHSVTNTCSVSGTKYSGTVDTPPATFPISEAQMDEWKTQATAGGTISGNKTVNGTETFGPKKITGNLTVGGTLYVTGPIWAVGDITVGNGGKIIIDSSLGNAGSVVIADDPANPTTKGYLSTSNNAVLDGNNNSGSYLLVIARKTSGTAVSISNNVTGDSIIYAPFATVTVSNNGQVNQITAYGLSLSNNVTITYITGLQSASFSNGQGGSWSMVPGTYVIEN